MNIRDVDQDGNMDILYASRADGSVTVSRIGIFTNSGNGGFSETILRTNTGGVFAGIDGSNIDGDSELEIIATDETNDTIYVYDASQAGYIESTIATCLDGPQIIHADDIDSDGDQDLLISGVNSDNVAVFDNDGLGNFSESIAAESLDGARNILSGDIDNDGSVDYLTDARFDDGIATFD